MIWRKDGLSAIEAVLPPGRQPMSRVAGNCKCVVNEIFDMALVSGVPCGQGTSADSPRGAFVHLLPLG
jgi:hypothetical protein